MKFRDGDIVWLNDEYMIYKERLPGRCVSDDKINSEQGFFIFGIKVEDPNWRYIFEQLYCDGTLHW